MNSPIDEFGKTAQKLSRNPLGIIALFIVLVYGIAGLVLGISSEHLQSNERLPLIWFLVCFPVIVLIAFYRLVALHHVKLYAPNDFPDKEGFFRVLTPAEQKQKLDTEIQAIETEMTETNNGNTLSIEMEGSGMLKTISTRHAYVLAEELAFREIESEYGVSIHRQVAVGPDYGFDGIFLKQGLPVAVEIKYSRSSLQMQQRMIQEQIRKFSTMAKSMKPIPTFMLAIVVDGLTCEQRDAAILGIQPSINESKLPILLRLYDFDTLKEKYGVAQGT